MCRRLHETPNGFYAAAFCLADNTASQDLHNFYNENANVSAVNLLCQVCNVRQLTVT